MRIYGSAVALLLLASAACGDDAPKPLIVMIAERRMELGASEFKRNATGCMEVSRDTSGGTFRVSSGAAGTGAAPVGVIAPPSQEFTVERSELPSGLRVTVSFGAQLLASELYTFEFLETHVTDVIDVTTADGTRHQIAHRGASECDETVDLFAQMGGGAP